MAFDSIAKAIKFGGEIMKRSIAVDLMLAVVGLASGAEKHAAREPESLVRIEIEPEHTLTFYEPAPGELVMVESLNRDQQVLLRGPAASDAIALLKRARPDEEVPSALQEAYDRARAASLKGGRQTLRAGRPPAVEGNSARGVAPAEPSSWPAPFVNELGGCDHGAVHNNCRVNWSGGYVAWSTSSAISCLVDHYEGDGIHVEIAGLVRIQSPGTVQAYGAQGAVIERRFDIFDASGDGFHVGCRWD